MDHGAVHGKDPAAGISAGLGEHVITVTGTDATGNTAACSFNVTVVDNTPPVIAGCPSAITQANDAGLCGAVVTYTAPVGTDNCPRAVTVQTAGLASGAAFPVGTTVNTFEVTDAAGNKTTCSFNVTVQDTEPPQIASVQAMPNVLWPANHKMVAVTVAVAASDTCEMASCRILAVSSNEPDECLGDGDTAGDIQVTGDLTLLLRAERSGKGNGRIYTVTVKCPDTTGNASTATVTVTVPCDQGTKK